MAKVSRKKFYIILGVAVVVVLAFCIYLQNQNFVPGFNSTQQNSKNQQKAAAPKTGSTSTKKALTRSEALEIYYGRTIQFTSGTIIGGNCLLIPTNPVFKKGTNVMLDNQTKKPLTVYLDGQAYSIQTAGFKIVNLTTSSPLPHVMKVDCGGGKNNGTITLQK